MTQKKSKTLVASAVSLALSSMMLSASLNAGIINNSNPTAGGFPGSCGLLESDPTACIGAWDLGNVTVKQFHADGTEFGTGLAADGTYATMIAGDSFSSIVNDWDTPALIMAKVGGKVWPVGEPTGIKAVYGDTKVKNGKPANCIINTAYLDGLNDSDTTTDIDKYLDNAKPEPVICSSGFQTHKRFKIAMQPATVEGIADGQPGKPIDLVFDVTDGDGLQPYQVFSKINNYTGKRLAGYKIIVGVGKGSGFKSASELGIESKLYISLGVAEGTDSKGVPDGSDIFDATEGLATFSHGLFGPEELPHFPANGFFDVRTAGFNVVQGCVNLDPAACPAAVFPATVKTTDVIYSTAALPSNYVEAPVNFGDWLHYGLAPMGIFWDFDNDPTTDADLMAYWNGTAWIKNNDSGFAAVTENELNTWAADPLYSVDTIEDTVNLGINYIVKVGDDLDNDPLTTSSKVTIRIIPVVGDQTLPAPWMTNAPAAGDLLPVSDTPITPPPTTTTSDGGGGCAVGGNGRFDPTLPALLAAGLGFFGWRRFKSGK